MPSRPKLLKTGFIYHVFNRGVEKRIIFPDRSYYQHFMTALSFYKKDQPIRLSDHLDNQLPTQYKNNKSLVALLCFCLMPNHFHLILKQLTEGGVSRFMNNIANSYTKYLNKRLERVGHLFQGSFKSKLIESEESFLQVSRYIHLNPLSLIPHPEGENTTGISEMNAFLKKYPYSSYGIYLGTPRDTSPCDRREIRKLTKMNAEYENFVIAKIGQDSRVGIEDLTLD